MATKTTKEMTEKEWVITKDGIRMTKREYLDMIEAERY